MSPRLANADTVSGAVQLCLVSGVSRIVIPEAVVVTIEVFSDAEATEDPKLAERQSAPASATAMARLRGGRMLVESGMTRISRLGVVRVGGRAISC
jgi:hypothetical protein